ncbi:hypothetical protein EV143_11324 [Flavobacterium chryseum]|uniref:hypothetical protein n=1 Tax=Flavobacterium sp. P3160 TaxID=2512113 RepID=UPI0010DD3848|nr:hypothetical protein [Flavobacterium sp. P3160]TDO69850.1 hypothetical protein EV143_11324 [Flavobacterium sp. P3160]
MLKDLVFSLKIRNIIIEIKKNIDMGTDNLGSKKINGEQKNIDESKGKNVSHEKEQKELKLKKEVVTDKDGKKEVVARARNENEVINEVHYDVTKTSTNGNRGVATEDEAKKTVENKDRNSDVEANRYPNSHPDNHKDRGNMKLDEED